MLSRVYVTSWIWNSDSAAPARLNIRIVATADPRLDHEIQWSMYSWGFHVIDAFPGVRSVLPAVDWARVTVCIF